MSEGTLDYSSTEDNRFTQTQTNAVVFADQLADPDDGKSLELKELIRKGYPEYYYKEKSSNVYTLTAGDTITDQAGNQYYIASVNDSGEIASQEDITALEPERQRLTEEEQEQTGGGYYPALESYLDRTSDEERRRLEEYKYSIDTNMEGDKHTTTILLNNKRIFRFGYQMSGNKNLIKLVSELIRNELEAVEI